MVSPKSHRLFQAYFDASGHPQESEGIPVMFVAGCVTHEEKWRSFSALWRELLLEFRVTPPFHMTEFEYGRGQFADWKNDEERREWFRHRAAAIIKRTTNKTFAIGVVIPDLRAMFEKFDAPGIPQEPYPWLALEVCQFVVKWAQRRVKKGVSVSLRDKIQFIFENGDRHKGLFMNAFQAEYRETALFREKSECVQFQAADFVAWQCRRWLKQRLGDVPRGRLSIAEIRNPIALRQSFQEMLRLLPPDSLAFVEGESLERLFAARYNRRSLLARERAT